MDNWEKIAINHLLDDDVEQSSNNLLIEANFKQIRKAAKNKHDLLSDLRDYRKDNKSKFALRISNQKSDLELLNFLESNNEFIKSDFEFLSYSLSDINIELPPCLKAKTFLDITDTISPRDYEKTFNSLAKMHFRGISLFVESFKRSHIILAHKFGLKFAITGIIHERHENLANESDTDLKIYG